MSSAREMDTVDVAIVGGGVPSLVLATQLARQTPDLRVVVIERSDASARNPQGVLVHPATHVVLERCGMRLPEDAMSGRVEWLEEYRHGRRVGRFDVRHRAVDRDAVYTPYNIGLATLADAALPVFDELVNGHIRYGTTVADAERHAGMWTLMTVGADGARRRMRASLLVAAEGRDSPLRSTSGIGVVRHLFPGHVDVLAVSTRRPGPPAISMVVGDRAATTVVDNGVGPNTLLFDMQPDGREPNPAEVRLRPQVIDRVRAAGLEVAQDTTPLFSTSLRSSTVRCDCWYRDGLLLLGDAAHAMHNLGGQGFNIAVQNAAALAPAISNLLRTGSPTEIREFEEYRIPYVTALQDNQDQFFDALAEGRVSDESWLRPLHEALTLGQSGLSRYIEPVGGLIKNA
ncbi:FAD-dependent oxidoreductase [Promicromonospora umidemergens]|uniref:FAD-dependent oxidoreductase n=1 Tax=Promicromonospora umidemergens TaxID=629679 RepID=UPI0020A24091|nr:NAD(P)/FAD-dependent oxidoreductase [Promicromonospora umidemergens]